MEIGQLRFRRPARREILRNPSISTINYAPADVPTNPADLPRYLREEFEKIQATVSLLAAGHLDKQYSAPAKPRDGDIRYATGAPNWNPGAGAGVYYFNGTIWKLLG